MKKLLLFFFGLLAFGFGNSQVTNPIYGDTVRVASLGGNGATLKIENNTKTVKGFLYNNGNGVTIFKHGAVKLNDSTYVIGSDTIIIKLPNTAQFVKYIDSSTIYATRNYVLAHAGSSTGGLMATDTASMLSPYLRAALAASTYYPISNPSGYITGSTIAGKVNYTDTASMLNPYMRAADGVKYTDTSAMLSPYYHTSNPSGYITGSAISGKVNYTDTAAMLSPYYRASNPSGYLTNISGIVAGGDLSGTYSNPGVAKFNGQLPAYYLNRANHTGTQPASTISDFSAAVTNITDYLYPHANVEYNNPNWIVGLDWNKITARPTTLAGYGITDAFTQSAADGRYVSLTGSYTNPSWLTSIPFSKLTSTPTTLSGYGITDIPSQSGNNGKVLGTDGSAMSWVSAGSGGATQPQALGTIFSTNTWANTTNWTANGATPSVSGNKLVVTYASGNLPSADYNYYTMLEKWNFFARIIATSTSAKIGIGIHSTNVYEGFSLYAQVDASTGYLTLTSTDLYGSTFTPTIQATSAGHLTVNANDKIIINLERDIDSVYCYALDATTAAGWVKCSFAYNTSGTGGTPNTGRFGFVCNAGAFKVDSMGISSNELKNANMYVTCDSKGTYVADNFASRWPQKLANFYYPCVVSIGGSEGVRDVINRLPEIVALSPKYVLLCIGRNDVANAYSNLYTDYATIVSTLTTAGIAVVNMNQIYEAYGISLATLANWIAGTYPTSYIDTYTPTSQLGSTGQWLDQIHPVESEHDIVYNTVIQSRKIPTIYDWRSMVRMNVPPPVIALNSYNSNQFIGGAGNNSVTVGDNYGWGPGALVNISTGRHNIAVGPYAANSESDGSSNIHIGDHAGWQNKHSTGSIFIGAYSGVNALYAPTYAAASDNIFIGIHSGTEVAANGSHNVIVGNYAGNYMSTPINKFLVAGGGSPASSLLWGDFNGQLMVGKLGNSTPPVLTDNVALEVYGGALKLPSNGGSNPSPVEGMMYYDYTKHRPYWYNGTAWTPQVATKNVIVSVSGTNSVCYNNTINILNPTTTLSSLTIAAFGGVYASDGDIVEFVATKSITGVTYYFPDGGGGAGQCVNCPTSLVPGVHYRIVFDASSGNWY